MALEGDAYLRMEQEGLECKQKYEERIAEIKRQNTQAINKLVKEFEVNLLKVQEEMRESKKVSDDLRHFYKNTLDEHEQEHEVEIINKREVHKDDKQKLENEWK